MIERPQAIDDRDIVAGAGAETDTVANLAGEDFDFALVSPFARRRKVLRGIGGCLAWLDFADNCIEALAYLFVPIFFFGRRLAADDERSIRTAAISHVSGAAIGTIDEIADLDDPAGRMATAIEGHRPRAPTARHCRFQSHLVTGRGS